MLSFYGWSKKLFCLPDKLAEPHPYETLVDVDLKDFPIIFSLCMPEEIMLNKDEDRCTDQTRFETSNTNQLKEWQSTTGKKCRSDGLVRSSMSRKSLGRVARLTAVRAPKCE
jgi:hypothetical protein